MLFSILLTIFVATFCAVIFILKPYVKDGQARNKTLEHITNIIIAKLEPTIVKLITSIPSDTLTSTILPKVMNIMNKSSLNSESTVSNGILKIKFNYGSNEYYHYLTFNNKKYRKGLNTYAIINGEEVDLKICPGVTLDINAQDLNAEKIFTKDPTEDLGF